MELLGCFNTGTLWGSNSWALLPIATRLGALAIIALTTWFTLAALFSSTAPHRLWLVVVTAAAFLMCRASTPLLGDGFVVIASALRGGPPAPYEPLASLYPRAIYALVRWMSPHSSAFATAWTAISIGSIVAGVLFAAAALALGRLLLPCMPPRVPHGITAAAFLLLITQGYVELFCGYVEHYGIVAAIVGWYLVLALRFLSGGRTLLATTVVLVVGIATHMVVLMLLPSWLALAIIAAKRRQSLEAAVAVAAGVAVAIGIGIPLATAGVPLPTGLTHLASDLLTGSSGPSHLFSIQHAIDLLNEQHLIGPASVALAGVITAVGFRTIRYDVMGAFLMTACAGTVAGAAIAGPSNLGYARNWDLLAATGVVGTAATVYLLGRLALSDPQRRTLLLSFVVVSAIHTAPWLLLNADERPSIARFMRLPLGGSLARTSIGYWYALSGKQVDAEREWIEALRLDAHNKRAYYLLGFAGIAEHQYGEAAGIYWRGLTEFPDDARLAAYAGYAFTRSGNWARARESLTLGVQYDVRVRQLVDCVDQQAHVVGSDPMAFDSCWVSSGLKPGPE